MDYRELLKSADVNREKTFQAPRKPPNEKLKKSGVQSDGIRKFLEKKKAEEAARAAEERLKKEQLLALRAQNTKNNKKAKMMACRTKDNDYSRIKLTEDELETKKKIEDELVRKKCKDKVERMKTRIDMEEQEKLLPRKRKRRSKQAEMDEELWRQKMKEEAAVKAKESSRGVEKNLERKPRPAGPPPSYAELLKIASSSKSLEPDIAPVKKKTEERLLTKKERKIYEEEQERLKRRQERLERGDSLSSYRTNPPPSKHSSSDKKGPPPPKVNGKIPVPPKSDQPRFKIPKGNVPTDRKEATNSVPKAKMSSSSNAPKQPTNHNREPKRIAHEVSQERRPAKPPMREENRLPSKQLIPDKPPKKKIKIAAPPAPPPPPPAPVIDTQALAAVIAKQVKEDLEKQIEAKYAAKFESLKKEIAPKEPAKLKPSGSENKSRPPITNGTSKLNPVPSKKNPPKVLHSKPVEKVNKAPPPPAKKPFHINPYLEPPRRRLEPIRPQKPIKRRIESDDDEDDDMSDFIEDGPSQNDENYSEYIKEIFGYDRARYLDEDEDDIQESSFVEQMKEETRSAKLGFLEDLEEERKLREQEKKWKQKQKLKKK